ncbi:radical SAM protein [Kitasatospora sp. NPDC057198]|uniref:radical SAM protein n=1 Tax=Kitasatospora sp. NPDC057198 TaxID=3346046 RepID=UPI0036394297
MEKVSRYLVVGDETYSDASGVGVRLVFATRTARLLAVDPDTAAALRAGDPDGVAPGLAGELRRARILVPADEDERAAVLERNRRASADLSAVHVALLPTSYCNMGCAYCGQEHTAGGLSRDHRDKVRARVLRKIGAPSTRSARIDWFGAEPMVGYAVIRSLAPAFVAAAAGRGIPYSSVIVTNGSLLTPAKIRTLVGECGVTQFEITLDGPPEVHDVHRPLKNGKGSFRHIVEVVGEALEDSRNDGALFRFRTNVDIGNRDSVPRYLELMAELGMSRPNVNFSIMPVHSWGNDVSAVELAGREFAERQVEWFRMMAERRLNVQLVPTAANAVVCPAVTTSAELISSTGKVFSCSEYPLVPEAERQFALTDISAPAPGPHRPVGQFDDWHEDVAENRTWCGECVFMPTCGGACPKAWREGNPPCPSYKYNFQGRLAVLAAQAGLLPAGAGR